MIDLDEADKLGKAATPEPWSVENVGDMHYAARVNTFDGWLSDQDIVANDDGEFICFVRNNWQAILDELRDYRALKEYHTAHRGWDTGGLTISYWEQGDSKGWFIFDGPYPQQIAADGSPCEKAIRFDAVCEAISALRLYVKKHLVEDGD